MGQQVAAYHEHSKHQPYRLAPGPGHLDWASQPDPFRTYAGAQQFRLPLGADRLTADFRDLYRSAGSVPVAALNLASVAHLLELSLGLSAWKVYGASRWALRCNPSSGNLHPTEGYVVLPALDGIEAGVYHYLSRDHLLEQRRVLGGDEAAAWNGLFPAGGFLVGLTSIHWREAWKYGDRAYRYCQLDVGHALAAMRYAAAALGWQVRLLIAPATRDVARLLGVAPSGVKFDSLEAEAEHADLLMQFAPMGVSWVDLAPKVAAMAELAGQGPWLGRPNRLSRYHEMAWPLIDDVAEWTRQPWQMASEPWQPASLPELSSGGAGRAVEVIRQRRSAQAFDGQTALAQSDLWTLLDATLPRAGCAPWDLLPWAVRVFPVLMIHRVEGLEAGVYLLVRDPERLATLQVELDGSFQWARVAVAPDHLPLYLLRAGDFQEFAHGVSCHQEIASDGVLSLGMLTEFPAGWEESPWIYRQLYWEAGVLGQVLYLEAEAVGMRGTGIGCFMDDAFHQMIGLRSNRFQSLYHFTLGKPVVDERLRSEPPYG
ncbi:MAG: nitroreductase family protein [Magnetococcales bacterium]|nr:nitroreductase family protein [Magnetococcales bacterium]